MNREEAAARAMRVIESCDDPASLHRLARNARVKGEEGVARAADLRRYAVLPSAQPGTVEHDVWQSIHALEGELTAERGTTTRQLIKRVGEVETVRSLVMRAEASQGFAMLLDRDLGTLTFEAVAMRHPDRFGAEVLAAAAARLVAAGTGSVGAHA